jgi:hypothetical protein
MMLCLSLTAQQIAPVAAQALTNDSVIKLVAAGLSDDLIVSTINALPSAFDISPDGLIALKAARVSDKLVSVIVLKTSAAVPASMIGSHPSISEPPPASAAQASGISAPEDAAQKSFAPAPGDQTGSTVIAEIPRPAASAPRVFLQSASKGNNRNAARDQSMEMSKDLEKDCQGVKVTIIQQAADYTVLLNHIEAGFVRDNQIQVANKDGDLISKTKEGGSISAGMKKAALLFLRTGPLGSLGNLVRNSGHLVWFPDNFEHS